MIPGSTVSGLWLARRLHVWRCCVLLVTGALACKGGGTGRAGPLVVRAAVAANFAAAQSELAQRFERETGVKVETSLGATGTLYAQIVSGAPFDVFLAADTLRPARLEVQGLAVPGTRFTYAAGRLVLFAPRWDTVGPGNVALTRHPVEHVAIADPRTAPYGVAARQVLERWGLWETFDGRTVRGENVGQAFQFVASGAATVGVVALSQVTDRPPEQYWIIPQDLHSPLRQDAVLLREGEGKTAARRYLAFLKTEEARRSMASFGYEHP